MDKYEGAKNYIKKKTKKIVSEDEYIKMQKKDFDKFKDHKDMAKESAFSYKRESPDHDAWFDIGLEFPSYSIKDWKSHPYFNTEKTIHSGCVKDMFIREFHNPGYSIRAPFSEVFTTMIPLLTTQNKLKGPYFYGMKGKMSVIKSTKNVRPVAITKSKTQITMEILNRYLKGKTKIFQSLAEKKACLVGSALLSLLLDFTFVPKDIDIFIPNESAASIGMMAAKIMIALDYTKMEKQSQTRYILTKTGEPSIEVFTTFSKISSENFVRFFHLPCIKNLYSFNKAEVYAFPSFMEYIRTGICSYNVLRWYSKNVTPLEIFTKYFKRGVNFLLNGDDAGIFMKHLREKNIKCHEVIIDIP
jgi:hypothetical protein